GAARATLSIPIMLPAPGRFSTKNCCMKALEKCSAMTRAMMSVPPAGGEGTTMRTGRAGHVCASACVVRTAKPRAAARIARCMGRSSVLRCHELAGAFDRLRRHQHEGDDAWLRALVDPVVDGAALHQHVA